MTLSTCNNRVNASAPAPDVALTIAAYPRVYVPYDVVGAGASLSTGAVSFATTAVRSSDCGQTTTLPAFLAQPPRGVGLNAPGGDPPSIGYYVAVGMSPFNTTSAAALAVRNAGITLQVTSAASVGCWVKGLPWKTDLVWVPSSSIAPLNGKPVYQPTNGDAWLLFFCGNAWFVKGKPSCLGSVGWYWSGGTGAATLWDIAGATMSCACPSGSSVDAANRLCVACTAPGSTSDGLSGSCVCGEGFYGSGAACTPCAVGTFKTAVDSAPTDVSACGACPSGQTTLGAGRSACVCAPGYQMVSGACTLCPANSYNPAANGVCAQCPVGKTGPAGAVAGATCTDPPEPSASSAVACSALYVDSGSCSGFRFESAGKYNTKPAWGAFDDSSAVAARSLQRALYSSSTSATATSWFCCSAFSASGCLSVSVSAGGLPWASTGTNVFCECPKGGAVTSVGARPCRCPAPQVAINGVCAECSAGKYPDITRTSCLDCPAALTTASTSACGAALSTPAMVGGAHLQ